MRLVLVRHGQTTSNVAELLDTAEPGADLTDLGRRQAQALVPALADVELDAVYVSTLVRTHQTAAPLLAARGIEPVERAGIREIQAGDVEMAGDLTSIKAYLSVVASWFRGELDRRMPGGETGAEVLARFDEVVAEAAASGAQTVALFSHGAVLRFWAATRSQNIDPPALARSYLSNTGVLVLDGSPEAGWTCLTWEDEAMGGPELTDRHDGPTG